MYTPNLYVATSGQTQFDVTFSYRDRASVKVSVGGADASFTWVNATRIALTNPASNGDRVVIYRETEVDTPEVSYEDASVILKEDLNASQRQSLDHSQEVNYALKRSFKVPHGSVGPELLGSPNKILAWDDTGQNLRNLEASDLATVSGFADARVQVFTGTGSQTQFEIDFNPGVLANLDISVGGVTQTAGVDFLWDETTVTFSEAPPAGVPVQIRYARPLTPLPNFDDLFTAEADAEAAAAAAEAALEEAEDVRDATISAAAAVSSQSAAAAAAAVATAADRVQTGLDRTATAADRVQTGLDRATTAADRAVTTADRAATAADRVQTGLDRVQTGLDRAATNVDVGLTTTARTQAELAALAAGAPIYVTMPTAPFTGVPSPFLFSTAAGVAVYSHDGSTTTQVGFLGTVSFPNVAALLAFTGSLAPVGTRIFAGRFRYEVVASGEHLTTAGAQKLVVLPGEDGFDLEAFGADLTGTNAVNTVLTAANTAAATAGKPLVLQGGIARLLTSATLTADVIARRGGKFQFGGGVVLTFDGLFEAGRYEVFTGSLSASVGPRFSGGAVEEIYPEWFGGRATGPSGPAVDSAEATQQALNTASRGTYGFTYRVQLGLGVYHWSKKVVAPVAGLKQLVGRGLGSQVRGMDAGSGFPTVLFELVNGTDNTRIADMTFYGGSTRQVNFGLVSNTSMKHTNITNVVFSSFGVACVKSLEWTNLCHQVRFEASNVGLWIANVANNNDLTIDTCRFVACEMPLVTGPGANIRVKSCQFQGALAAPYTKAFAYVWGGAHITFDNCYFETQFSGGGLAGMAFTSPEPVVIFAGIIFNNQPYFTDDNGTVTTTLSRAASPGGRSVCAIRECLLSVPSYYAAGAGGDAYTAGAVNILSVGGVGTGGAGTASVVGGKISNVTITTPGTKYQIGDEVLFEQGGNTTARGRVLSTTTNNGLSTVGIGAAAAIYPGNIDTLTIEHTSIPSTGAMFVLYNDPSVCEPGRIIVRQTPSYSVTAREFFLVGSNTSTVRVSIRNIEIDTIPRIASALDATAVNYHPQSFTFAGSVSSFLRQGSRYQQIPSWRLTLNAGQQVSDALTGSLTVGSSGALNSELVGRRVYLAVRKSESAANVKLRLTLSVTSGTDTITTQNYDASTSFTKSSAVGWEEVSIAIPANGGTLSWSIEVIASTAGGQFVEIMGLPIISMAGIPVSSFPRWVFERPLVWSGTWDPPALAAGASASNTFTVIGSRAGDLIQAAPPASLSGLLKTESSPTANAAVVDLFNKTAGTVDLASGTWRGTSTFTS